MVQILSAGWEKDVHLTFLPHLVPMIRSIHATLYARLTRDINVQALFERYYQSEIFIDIMPENRHPNTRSVRGTTLCRISVTCPQRGNVVVVTIVIDNLVKGAAGQAVQNMNIMFGLSENTSLRIVPLLP